MTRPESFRAGVMERIGRYPDAIRVPGNSVQVLTSATPGLTPTGAIPSAFDAEAEQAWLNVRKVLLVAGASLDDISSVRTWLTSAADIATYAKVFDRFIHHEPVGTLVVVEQLICPEARVQIEGTAVLPTGDT